MDRRPFAHRVSVPVNHRAWRWRRKHTRRFRRCVAGGIAFLGATGMLLQQTHADYYLVHGFPATREFISVTPSLLEVVSERLTVATRAMLNHWRDVTDGPGETAGGGTAQAPAVRAGAPWPWQAADAAAPYTIVNLANGNLYTAIPIVSWQDVSFNLYHNSFDVDGLDTLSPGWAHSYSARLTFGVDQVVYQADDGAIVVFTGTDDGDSDQRAYRMRLALDDQAGEWSVIMDTQSRRVFDLSGRLLRVEDASGATVALTYTGNRVSQVVDPAGRTLTLGYDVQGRLRNVTAPPFRKGSNDAVLVPRAFEFEYSAAGRLEKIWSPRRGEFNQKLFHVAATYDVHGRLMRISDYQGFASDLEYDAKGRAFRATHPEVYDFLVGDAVRTSRTYYYLDPCAIPPPSVPQPDPTASGGGGLIECSRLPTTKVIDERGGETRYTFDAGDRLLRIRDPLGRQVGWFRWNSMNRLTATVNVLGGLTTITYNAQGDPLTTTTPRGTTQTNHDALHNLTQVIDPVGNVTSYFYGDEDNPTKTTAISGDGAADTTMMRWGCQGAIHQGLLTTWIDPNQTTQGFQYEDRNIVRHVAERVDLHDCPGSQGGANGGDTEECAEVDQSVASNETGETRVTGKETCIPITGTAKSGSCTSQNALELSPYCRICGCAADYDEAGSVTNLTEGGCTNEGPVAGTGSLSPFDPPQETSQPVMYCGGIGQPYQYDGNQRLMCAWDHAPGFQYNWDVENEYRYDARGRLRYAKVFAEEAVLPAQYLYPHVQVYPSYRVDYDYSDTTGGYRLRYERVLQGGLALPPGGLPQPAFRRFRTTYEKDPVGRITRIERADNAEGPVQVTTYTYSDSTVAPAVTETRPDGSRTLVFLDADGAVRRIAHTKASGIVLASFEYTRDAKGRITRVQEEVQDSQAADGYRSDTVDYVYGDGNLSAADLDNPALAVPNADRLYYDFLAELGEGRALLDQDPNRLVMERRFNADPDDAMAAVTYKREYWYDPGGNRLAMRESQVGATLAQDVPVAVTRYNYYTTALEEVGSPLVKPGTPVGGSPARLNYEGGGRNQLFSAQRHFVNDPDRVEVTRYGYGIAVNEDQRAVTYRGQQEWRRGSGGAWFVRRSEATSFSYRKEQVEKIESYANDYCPNIPECGSCDEPCAITGRTEYAEFNTYDIFGRRVASMHCDEPSSGGDTFYPCKWQTTMYDYDGLSQNVLAVRRSPVLDLETVVPDRYLSTFTYGPLGIVTRTEEFGKADTSDNADHYYLADVMGNHAAMYVDHDGDELTSRILQSQVHDAFGNLMTDSVEVTAEYAWRGQEGSETDAGPDLVLMQARHYDPEIGRFLQEDTLPIASLTTQGMNRYIYCENDPVNRTDPNGHFVQILLIAAFVIGVAFGVKLANTNESFVDAGITTLIAEFLLTPGFCKLALPLFLEELGLTTAAAGLLAGIGHFMALFTIAFLMGLVLGLALGMALEPNRYYSMGGESAWQEPTKLADIRTIRKSRVLTETATPFLQAHRSVDSYVFKRPAFLWRA